MNMLPAHPTPTSATAPKPVSSSPRPCPSAAPPYKAPSRRGKGCYGCLRGKETGEMGTQAGVRDSLQLKNARKVGWIKDGVLWLVSSCKPGLGIDHHLRDNCLDTYWHQNSWDTHEAREDPRLCGLEVQGCPRLDDWIQFQWIPQIHALTLTIFSTSCLPLNGQSSKKICCWAHCSSWLLAWLKLCDMLCGK